MEYDMKNLFPVAEAGADNEPVEDLGAVYVAAPRHGSSMSHRLNCDFCFFFMAIGVGSPMHAERMSHVFSSGLIADASAGKDNGADINSDNEI